MYRLNGSQAGVAPIARASVAAVNPHTLKRMVQDAEANKAADETFEAMTESRAELARYLCGEGGGGSG